MLLATGVIQTLKEVTTKIKKKAQLVSSPKQLTFLIREIWQPGVTADASDYIYPKVKAKASTPGSINLISKRPPIIALSCRIN